MSSLRWGLIFSYNPALFHWCLGEKIPANINDGSLVIGMQTQQFFLMPHANGTQRWLSSYHYGQRGSGKKCYIQAGLHASEIPGLLVAHYLRKYLDRAEANGEVCGEIVLVPVANPVGLDQTLLSSPIGRFDLSSGQNFNRTFPGLSDALYQHLKGKLTQDTAFNIQLIRQTLKKLLFDRQPKGQLGSMQQHLAWLACDADLIIDLHCDSESVVHLYTHPYHLDMAKQLGSVMQAQAILYSAHQGGGSFDETQMHYWITLRDQFPDFPISLSACAAFTLELRGQADVSHDVAEYDCQCLLEFLRLNDVLKGSVSDNNFFCCDPTPLEGVEVIYAQSPGIIVYHKQCGEWCAEGDTVADIVDPITHEMSTYWSGTDGVLYTRQNKRYATTGTDLAYIAGSTPRREGMLLSA